MALSLSTTIISAANWVALSAMGDESDVGTEICQQQVARDFLQTLNKEGYISKKALSVYNRVSFHAKEEEMNNLSKNILNLARYILSSKKIDPNSVRIIEISSSC